MGNIPIWEKYALTREEAAAYFHIGENRLGELVNSNVNAEYLLWVGNRALFKREKFEKYLDKINVL